MIGGNLGAAIQMLKVMNQQGGQSWESYFSTRTPSNLVATVISATEINLTWDDATEAADGLKIYLSTDGGANYTYNSTVAFGVEAKSLTGLTHNTTYTIKLVAYKDTNESDPITDSEKTIELWYLAGGVAAANCKGAYQPIEAASLAASYTNLITPGTNNAAPGTAPTWDAVNGWKFNGTSQYLTTGIVPENDQTWSMIIRLSEYTTGDDTIAGIYEGAGGKEFNIVTANSGAPSNRFVFGNGGNSYKKVANGSGIVAVCGNKAYLNGIEITDLVNTPIPSGSGNITYDIYIGAVHYTTPANFFDGNIQAIAIYDKVLSPTEVLAISTSMSWLGLTERVLRQNYVNQLFGALICFDMASFRTSAFEVGQTDGNVNTFAPTGMDVDNWLDACKSAGMKYAILTAKHHAGFKLWNSASKVGANPVYGINSTAWYAANGNPDIVGLFVAGCRARGLKIGLYFSIQDLTWEDQTGENETTDAAAYIAMIEAELTELLSNYGNIDSFWFDGWDWHMGQEEITYATIYNFIKAIQANCLVVNNSHVHPSITSEIETYEVNESVIPAGNLLLAEFCTTIRNDGKWFYHPDLTHIATDYYDASVIKAAIVQANSRNGAYLLGLTPGTDGRLPPAQVTRLAEIGAL